MANKKFNFEGQLMQNGSNVITSDDAVAFIDDIDNEGVVDPDVVMTEVVVDSKLSTVSTNPVQNRVVTERINREESERKQEIAVERARINNLMALPEGSTTSDAKLEDICVGADGTQYASPGEAVRTQIVEVTDELDILSKSAGIEKTTLLNFATDVTTQQFSGTFILHKLKIRGCLDKISFKTQKVGTYEVDLSIWKLDNYVYTRVETRTFTGNIVDGQFTIRPNYNYNDDYYIGFYSVDDIYGYSYYENGIAASADRDVTTLTSAECSAYLPMCEIVTSHSKSIGINNIECHVGKGYKYSQIQEALDDNEDVECLTIYLHPSDIPYKRFSTMRKLNAAYPWDGIYCKRISIIGLDKYKCNVLDDSGNYETPPAEIGCNGVIENITFMARHTESTGVETTGSFAVHVDNRPKDANGMYLTFRNCDFISYQTAAVGLGLYKNQSIVFDSCNFKSYTDTTWKPNEDYDSQYMCEIGAYYMHTSMGYEHGNMGVSFRNCFLYHDGGAYAMRIHETEGYPTMWLECINNILHVVYGGAKCQFDGSSTNLQPYNFGNNATELNAT